MLWGWVQNWARMLHLTEHPSWLGTMFEPDKFDLLRPLKQRCQVFAAYASRWSQESVRDPGGSHGSHGTCVPGKPCLTRWRIFHRAEDSFRGPFEPFGLPTPPPSFISLEPKYWIRELVGCGSKSEYASHKSLCGSGDCHGLVCVLYEYQTLFSHKFPRERDRYAACGTNSRRSGGLERTQRLWKKKKKTFLTQKTPIAEI